MRNLWNDRLNNVCFGGLSLNDFCCNLTSCFKLSLILKSLFDNDCSDCLIFCIYFVRVFVKFFYLQVFHDSYISRVIVV